MPPGPAGGTITIGRGAHCDLVVPNDTSLASKHVEITWDGERARFRDLGTSNGTNVNGEEGRKGGDLKNGDWLRAGDTIFTIHVEGSSPPRPVTADAIELRRRAQAEDALSQLSAVAEREPLHAVLDMARDKRILTLCRESVEEYTSLYDGMEGENLADVAPHLVRLGPESRLLASLVREGFGKRWGIWLTSRQPQREVRRHLRRFLMVEIEDRSRWGETPHTPHTPRPARVYFRFYDPATITSFLPTSSPRQLEELFGDISAFFAETRSGELRRYPSPRALPTEARA